MKLHGDSGLKYLIMIQYEENKNRQASGQEILTGVMREIPDHCTL